MRIKPVRVCCNLLLLSFLLFASAAQAAVNLAVNVNPNPAQPNQQVVVAVTVTNSGASSASNLIVTMVYPSHMNSIYAGGTLVTGPIDTAASCGGGSNPLCNTGETLQWSLGTLAPGQVVQISLSPTVTSGTTDGTLIPWEATVSDTGGALGTDSATLPVDSAPELTVAIDADQDPVPAGGTLSYTLRYGNRSASSVTGTQLAFTLPANTSFVSATGGGTLNGNVVSWNLATLPAGAIAQQVVEVLVGAVADGTLLESEAVINGTSSAQPTERRATATDYVGQATPLALALTVNPLPAQGNQQVVVEMTVTNPTASTVSGGVVRLHYPSHMGSIYAGGTLVTGPIDTAASCNGGSNPLCNAGETLQWSLGTLIPGQAVQMSLSPTVTNGTASGTLIPWEATVSDDSGALGTESTTLPVDSAPELTVAIDADQDPVPAGGTLSYTLRYGNRSASSVTGTQLAFTLPANTSFVSATGGGTLNGNVVSWNLATLPAGAIAQQVVEVLVGAVADGTLLESEAVINGTSSAQPTERRATATDYVGQATPLALALTVNPLPAQGNQQVVVEMTVTNPTASTVFGGVVRLHYPSHMGSIYAGGTLVTGPIDTAASCNGGSNPLCNAGETLQWSLGTLIPGQAVQMSLSPTVTNGTASGTLIPWEATVSDDSGALGTESTTLPVDSAPELTVAIDADQDPVPAGGTLSYTLRYGNRSASSVTGTQLAFTLPANTSFVSATGGGTLNGNVVSWNLATLPAGAIAQQVVEVLVGAVADGTLLESEAVINGTSSAQPTERRATATDYVGQATPLALALTVNPLPAQGNQQVVVEMTVTNPTASTVFGGVVRLHYPSHMGSIYAGGTLVTGPIDTAASCNGGSNPLCNAGETLQWSLGTLIPGQAVQMSLSPTVTNGTASGTLIPWEATVSDDSGALGTESTTLPVDSAPELTVAIDADQDPVPAGGTLSYTLRYGNRSASSVTGTQLAFTLPANTSFVSATGGGTLNGNVVSWNLATLPAGAIAQQVVEVLVGAVADGTLLESEAVINGTSSAQPTERRATATDYVGQATPLALALTVNPLPAQGNQQVVVEMTVTNPTASTVFGGVVRLHYPSHMGSIYAGGTLVTGPIDTAASCNGGSNPLCNAGETLQWSLGTLIPGQVVQMSLSPTVANGTVDGTLIKWSALVTEDGLSLGRESETLPIGTCDFLSDSDCDGVNDSVDNCTEVANASQLDTDGDNYGNVCDADFDNTGFVNFADLAYFKTKFGSSDSETDLDGSGFVNFADLAIFKTLFGKAPGPSGLAP